MSDSVTKYFENEDRTFSTPVSKELKLSEEEIKEAYKVLAYYEKNAILYAAKILNDAGTL